MYRGWNLCSFFQQTLGQPLARRLTLPIRCRPPLKIHAATFRSNPLLQHAGKDFSSCGNTTARDDAGNDELTGETKGTSIMG